MNKRSLVVYGGVIHRVEEFQFIKIDEQHDFFIKKTLTENNVQKVEIKNVPIQFFAQVYKKYAGLDINDKDMLFYHEGFLAQFQEPLFNNHIKKKLSLK